MQQPLCHLYFLVVMEHLWSKYQSADTSMLIDLSRKVCQTQNIVDTTAEDDNMVLELIEHQAVLQMLIYILAIHLNPDTGHGVSDFQNFLDDINK